MDLFLVFALREDDMVGKWVLLILSVTIGFLLVLYAYRRARLYFAVKKKWMKTEATIKSGFGADLRDYGDDDAPADSFGWNPALQYFYQVAGEHYSGFFLLDRIFDSPDYAKDAAQEWMERKILIRYNPANPQESTFLEQDGAPPGSRSMSLDAPLSDLVTLSLK